MQQCNIDVAEPSYRSLLNAAPHRLTAWLTSAWRRPHGTTSDKSRRTKRDDGSFCFDALGPMAVGVQCHRSAGGIRRANSAFITSRAVLSMTCLSLSGDVVSPGRVSHLLGRLMAINYHNDNKPQGVPKKPQSGCGRLQITVVTWPRRAGAMTDRAHPTGWWLEQALRLSRLVPAFLVSSEADVANRSSTAKRGKGGVDSVEQHTIRTHRCMQDP